MSLLRQALKNGESLHSLEAKYGIKYKFHGQFQNLVQFKYNQITSPMGDPLVQEARGIILDEFNDWHPVAWPFNKFFNVDEHHAAKIDWSTAAVQEKVDGSLCILYAYNERWLVATSGTPDASGPVGNKDQQFYDLFWRVWDELEYNEDLLNQNYTYTFELMTKYNRIIIQHPKNRLVMTGIRNTQSGLELPLPEQWANFEIVRKFPFNTLENTLKSLEDFKGSDQEGYVVVDGQFNRVKIKHPEYIKLHHLVDNLSPKRILDCVRRGETLEVLSYFPEWKREFEEITEKYYRLCGNAESAYYKIAGIESQRDFAVEALKTPYAHAMFAVRAKRVNLFSEYYTGIRLEMLADMLGLRDGTTATP